MRYSRQKSIIKEFAFSKKSHPNAEWVYHEARKVIPYISLGTVYKSIKQLSRIGNIKTIYDRSVARFDWNTIPITI